MAEASDVEAAAKKAVAEEAAKEVSARETELVQALQTMKSALDSKDSELEAMALRETALKAK